MRVYLTFQHERSIVAIGAATHSRERTGCPRDELHQAMTEVSRNLGCGIAASAGGVSRPFAAAAASHVARSGARGFERGSGTWYRVCNGSLAAVMIVAACCLHRYLKHSLLAV